MADGGEEEDFFGKRYPLEEESEMLGEEAGELDKKRQLCRDQGMLEMHEWKDKLEELYPDCTKDGLDLHQALMHVAKATCLVVRNSGSQDRYEYHRRLESHPKLSAKDQKAHHDMAEKCFNTEGCGTGFLIYAGRHFLIVNNHVIMNEGEAKDADVYFDYDKDGQLDEEKAFQIERFWIGAPRTDHEEESAKEKLDFSILEVKAEGEEELQFLNDHAFMVHPIFDFSPVSTEESTEESAHEGSEVSRADLVKLFTPLITDKVLFSLGKEMSYLLNRMPIFMISHPFGLAKRLSCGNLTEIIKHSSGVRHTLGTCPGSSGGNLFVFARTADDDGFGLCQALHYRHNKAVWWKNILLYILSEAITSGRLQSVPLDELKQWRQRFDDVKLTFSIKRGDLAQGLYHFSTRQSDTVSTIKSDTATPITRARQSETQGNLSSSSLK